jgi:hypothetical protein
MAFALPGFTLGACALAVNGMDESGGGLADATALGSLGIDADGARSQGGMAPSASQASDSGNPVARGSAGDGAIGVRGPSGSSGAFDSGSSDEASSNGSNGGEGDGNGASPSGGRGPGSGNGSGKDGADASRRPLQDSSMK